MNASATVISVNPGKSTVGQLNPEAAVRRLRNLRCDAVPAKTLERRRALKFLFGLGSRRDLRHSGRLLLWRVAFAALLLVAFFAPGYAVASPAWILPAMAVSLLSGLFQRVAMTAASLWFTYLAVSLLAAAGTLDMVAAFCAMISGMMAVAGPGRWSLDMILRRRLHRLIVPLNRRRRQASRRLSYKAMQCI